MAATVIDTLFGDAPVEAWPPGDGATEFPGSAFIDARRDPERAIELWREVAVADVEPRHVAQAWMGLKKGDDVLAVYADRSVRYSNHAGGGIVLERAEGE